MYVADIEEAVAIMGPAFCPDIRSGREPDDNHGAVARSGCRPQSSALA